MLYWHLWLLSAIAANSSGVGLSFLCEESGLSRYKMRKLLKESLAVSAISRKKNVYFLDTLGLNLAFADGMASRGEQLIGTLL